MWPVKLILTLSICTGVAILYGKDADPLAGGQPFDEGIKAALFALHAASLLIISWVPGTPTRAMGSHWANNVTNLLTKIVIGITTLLSAGFGWQTRPKRT